MTEPLQAAANSIVQALRKDMKPKRSWKRTKAGFLQREEDQRDTIAALDGCLHEKKLELLALNRRLILATQAAFLLGCGFGGLIAWGFL